MSTLAGKCRYCGDEVATAGNIHSRCIDAYAAGAKRAKSSMERYGLVMLGFVLTGLGAMMWTIVIGIWTGRIH